MGKKIDKIALTALLAGALYLFFMSAFKSIPIAAAAAFIALALLKKLALPLNNKRREKRAASKRARETLDIWSKQPQNDIKDKVSRLIRAEYPGQLSEDEIHILPNHPLGEPVRIDDVFSIWKSRGGAKRAAIAAFTKASEPALALADTLDNPSLRIIDAPRLLKMLKKHEEFLETSSKSAQNARTRLRAAAVKGIISARSGRCALTGAAMCLAYFATGRLTLMISGTALLFIAFASKKRRGADKKLFAD